MAARITGMLAELSQPRRTANTATRRALLEQVSNMKFAVDFLESAPLEDNIGALKAVVKAAFALIDSSISLTSRFETCGFPSQPEERREVRQIKAIARYWSACFFLVSAARAYRTHFQHAACMFLEAPPVEIWPAGSGNKHFVHAEMQLLLWHETTSGAPSARHIGVSKKACFLCNCMIQACGEYEVASTHGELHAQWTIHSKGSMTESALLRLRAALSSTQNEVAEALEQARATRPRRAPPVQSAANSCLASLRTASASTIKAVGPGPTCPKQSLVAASSRTSLPQQSSSRVRTDLECEQVKDARSLEVFERVGLDSSLATLASMEASTRIPAELWLAAHKSSPSRPADHRLVLPGDTTVFRLDWLELHIQLEHGARPEADQEIACCITNSSGYSNGLDFPGNVIDVHLLAVGEKREYRFPTEAREFACLLARSPCKQVYFELCRPNAV